MRILTFLPFLLVIIICQESQKELYYVIGHMANTIPAVDFALSKGVNGLEMDLRFDGSTPKEFYHGKPCDCTCEGYEDKNNICAHLTTANSSNPTCLHGEGVIDMFEHIVSLSNPSLSFIYIDSKVDEMESKYFEDAGRNVVDYIIDYLFSNGFEGSVVINCPELKQFDYLISASKQARLYNETYMNRFYYTVDMEGKNWKEVFQNYLRLESRNRVYGNGISACVPLTYYSEIFAGYRNWIHGFLGMVYVWTIDKTSSAEKYLQYGATGIMTNYPERMVEFMKGKGLTLAAREDKIPTATADTFVISKVDDCDCDYHPGGCTISKVAQPMTACDCIYKLGWSCGGDVVGCSNIYSPYCENPDKSIESCKLGGGDCGGY